MDAKQFAEVSLRETLKRVPTAPDCRKDMLIRSRLRVLADELSRPPSANAKRSSSVPSRDEAPSTTTHRDTLPLIRSSEDLVNQNLDDDFDDNEVVTQVPVRKDSRKSSLPRKPSLAHIKATPKNLSPIPPGSFIPMIPAAADNSKITLCVDIDETLVHASFTPTHKHDVVIPLTMEGKSMRIYVQFRPYLKQFLQFISSRFEVVIFTASLSMYAGQLMDHLDPDRTLLGRNRLFREHCTAIDGSYVKDISLLGRPLDRVALIDNSPSAYLFQPRNAIPIESWFDDPFDEELLNLTPMLQRLAKSDDVYSVLDEFNSRGE